MKFCLYLLLLIRAEIVKPYCLYTNLDVNSVSIPTGQRDKVGCKRNVGAEVGCVQQFRCQSGSTPDSFGYYVVGDKTGGGVQIECVRYKWVLSSDKTSVPRCIKGCPVLTNKEMENSTYVSGKSETFRNGAQEFWPLETVVRTACKEGYVFKNIVHETKREDQHRCTANQGWLDTMNQKPFGWPAVCRAVCDPIDQRDIPNNVVMITNAFDMSENVRDYNGRKVLLAGSTYKFQCTPGFSYAFPHDRTGSQILICAGGRDFWYDSETRKNSAGPASCIPNGCPAITSTNIVSNSFFNYINNCSFNGGTVTEGCVAVIRCNTKAFSGNTMGYYMHNNPNGYTMTCQNGKWVRPDGTDAKAIVSGKYGEVCSLGCHSLTSEELQSSQIVQETGQKYRNDEASFYPIGSLIVTSCNEGFIRPNIINQDNNQLTFVCESSGWTNSDSLMNGNGNSHPASCERSCEISLPLPDGTKIELDSLIVRRNTRNYVIQNATATVSCENNFKPPTYITTENDVQILKCVGGSQGWKNERDGQSNSVPMICIESGSDGCTLIDANTHPNMEIKNNTLCRIQGGLYSAGCELKLRCASGFIPMLIDQSIDLDGTQALVCEAGIDGYTSNSGSMKNVQPMNCVASCEVIEEMVTAVYTKPPSNVVKYAGKSYLKSGDEVVIRCRIPDYGINSYADLVSGENILYRCFGGEDRYLRLPSYRYNTTPGDACSGVCRELEGNVNIGTLLTSVNKPDTVVNVRDGIRYVVNMEYSVRCASGYEFPSGSSASILGYQRLLCSNLSEGYTDLDTRQTNVTVTQCVASTSQKCEELTLNQWRVYIYGSENCTEPNSANCVLHLRCQNGSYSSTTDSNVQKVVCMKNLDGALNWESADNLGGPKLRCEPGCSQFNTTEDFFIREEWSSVIQFQKYFKQGSNVTIECSTG